MTSEKRCPLAHIAKWSYAPDGQDPDKCVESDCAWWTGDRCAVVPGERTEYLRVDCLDCAFRGTPADDAPCQSCVGTHGSNWQPRTEEAPHAE